MNLFAHDALNGLASWQAYFFYFMVYSFGGWLLENGASLIEKGHRKEDFLKGPFKPMYGLAPMVIIFLRDAGVSWAWLVPLLFIVPTAVEYVSGALLFNLFHRRWWDYTGLPLQINGHICLIYTAIWGVLSLICLLVLQPGVIRLYDWAASVWSYLVFPAVLFMLADLAVTVRSFRRGARLAGA